MTSVFQTEKACTHCGLTKAIDQFKMQRRKGGYYPTSWCRACANEASKLCMRERLKDLAVREVAREKDKRRYHDVIKTDPVRYAAECERKRISAARPRCSHRYGLVAPGRQRKTFFVPLPPLSCARYIAPMARHTPKGPARTEDAFPIVSQPEAMPSPNVMGDAINPLVNPDTGILEDAILPLLRLREQGPIASMFVVKCAAPKRVHLDGQIVVFKPGKIVDSNAYDVDALRAQGVQLEEVCDVTSVA